MGSVPSGSSLTGPSRADATAMVAAERSSDVSHTVSDSIASTIASTIALLEGNRKMRILILSSDTGGGHRASAEALRSAIQRLRPDKTHVDIVDYWVDFASGPFSGFPKQYTFLAQHPWMWKFTFEATRFPPGRALSETLINVFGHRNVLKSFQRYAPDLVISVHPLVNTLSIKVLRRISRLTGRPAPPYVTVVTDLGGAHPTWFHKSADMIYIPSDRIHHTAKRVGIPESRIRQLGLPVRPDFWQNLPGKCDMRERLGLRTELPTILTIGGGDGVGGLKSIVSALATKLPHTLGHKHFQIVAICGKNEKLKTWLASREWPIQLTALGFVSNMSDWMAASDILCTKAGPGTIAEGLIRGLPILVTGFLPGQEEMNAQHIIENRVGAFAGKPDKIVSIVAKWLSDDGVLQDMAQRAKQLGRPTASLDIVKDIFEVAETRISENLTSLRHMKQVSESSRVLLDNGLQSYIPHRRMLLDSSSSESHIVFRLKFLMRVVMGWMVAREAVRRTRDPSPADAIENK